MKLVSLVSNGIDSPVATYLISKKTNEIIIIHVDNTPFQKADLEVFTKIVKKLDKQISSKTKVYTVPNGENTYIFKQKCEQRHTCIFCKRMMLRIAEKIALKENASAIIMGDSLGQVASQTLQNLKVIDQAIATPVLRPLIGWDKTDIIDLSKKIGTYGLSTSSKSTCKAVPVKPATKAKLKNIVNEERNLDIEFLVEQSWKKSKLLTI